MVYERVQKSFGQPSSQNKHNPIVSPLTEQQKQADSQLSPKVKPSSIPSKEERDAIRRKIFDSIRRSGENQIIMREGLFRPTVRVQEAPDFLSVARTSIQAKLTIGEPGDKYEQEADRVASQVVNLLNAPVAQQSHENLQREETLEEDELLLKSEVGAIQRQAVPEEEEELQMKPMVQLQPGASGMTATPDLETSIQQARGGGQSLAENIRQPMEQAFGVDFSGVKVHTDSQSDQLNRSIQARAFTTGQDVFFRQGEYNPGSREGQELLAHELTHVVQQKQTHNQIAAKGVIQRNVGFEFEVGLYQVQQLRNNMTREQLNGVTPLQENDLDNGSLHKGSVLARNTGFELQVDQGASDFHRTYATVTSNGAATPRRAPNN